MADIQRWDVDMHGSMFESDDGPLVFHADHVAAVAAATENAVRDYAEAHYANGVKRYSEGVKAAREAVEVANGVCDCPRIKGEDHGKHCPAGIALAAIDALRGEP